MQENEFNNKVYNNTEQMEKVAQLEEQKQQYGSLDSGVPQGVNYGRQTQQRVTPLNHLMYSEDMRISRIIRRLMSDNQPAAALEICDKLDAAIRIPSNAAYICRSFEMLLDNLTQILKQSALEVLPRVSKILGLVGYINRTNFPIYKNYISKTYQNSKTLRKYLMLALKTTFKCDAVNLDLIVYSERVLEMLIDYLENAEKAETFICISDTILEFSIHYEIAFAEHFTDLCDIVVGWHLESEQPQSLKLHCALVLQYWAGFFLNELDFTYGLLGQFLEDINAWLEDLTSEGSVKKSKLKAELRIASFIGAFTTILKCLATPTEFVGLTADVVFIEHAVTTIMTAAKKTLASECVSEEIVVNINDFLSLLLTYNYKFKHIESFEELLKYQIEYCLDFNDMQCGSMLYLIVCLLRHQRTALLQSTLTLLLHSENNRLASLKLAQNNLNYKLLLKIYHEILLLKNVPLLQEAYKHIKLDINNSMNILTENNKNDFESAVQTINFYLSALSILATQTSSIISMYALDPSILELLIHNCKAAHVTLWTVEPSLHNALLNLIAVHCQKNHNFVTTSRLLHDHQYTSQVLLEQSRNSPTSEHFTQILQFFSSVLSQCKKLSTENLKLLLKWLQQLLDEGKQNIPILLKNQFFVNICKKLCSACYFAPLETAKCIQILLVAVKMPDEILMEFKATSIFQLDSHDQNIMETFADILAALPLNITMSSIDITNNSADQLIKMNELQKWYHGTTHYAPLRARFFKDFLDYLDAPFSLDKTTETEAKRNNSFLTIFSKCFVDQMDDENVTQYLTMSRQNQTLIYSWIGNEAARYCIRNKLRTTIGKPQETFLAIEAIVLKYARMLTSKDLNDSEQNSSIDLQKACVLQHRAHVLLDFLDALEKHIYNAAQGTAFAMSVAEKPAKTFFRINTSTCNEWFKRIRSGVCLIAIHCMKPEMAMRYSEKTLIKINQLNPTLLEHTLLNLVDALLTCKEADSLTGLHVWVRTKTDKNYPWIQYAAEQAGGNLEQAAKHYKALLEENNMDFEDQTKQFILEQLLHCYYFTGQWKEASTLLTTKSHIFKKARSSGHLYTMSALFYGTSTLDEIQRALSVDRSTNINSALVDMMNWSNYEQYPSRPPEDNVLNFSTHQVIRKIEDIYMRHTLNVGSRAQKNVLPENIVKCILWNLYESIKTSSIFEERKVEHANDFMLLNNIAHKISCNDISANLHDILDLVNKNFTDATISTKCLLWFLLIEQRAFVNGYNLNNSEIDNLKHKLYLDMAINAGKEGNFNFSQTLLERFFVFKGFNTSLSDIKHKLRHNEIDFDVTQVDLLHGIDELSKCVYNTTQTANQTDAIEIAATLCLQITEETQPKQTNNLFSTIGVKSLLNLADLIGQKNVNNTNNNTNFIVNLSSSTPFNTLLEKLPEPSLEFNDKKLNENIPLVDKAVGKLLNASTLQKSDSGEAWLAYGNWCYRWGKKLVELKNNENDFCLTKGGENELCKDDLKELENILKQNLSQEILLEISQVLQRYQFNNKLDAADDDVETNLVGSALDLIEQELRRIDSLKNLTTEEIMEIIKIWRRTHKTVYVYYESAIRAYLKFLNFETTNSKDCNRAKVNDECSFVTTTLRILRLVVKHAFALQDVLEEGLNTTPLRPWKVIIPQLFSRLNHHEPYVRKSLAQLLCRLAQDEPHAVIFPAVVGSQEEGLQSTFNNEKVENSSSTNAALLSCFGSLVAKLSDQAPQTVRHVQLLVKELRRVALLGEEHWHHALSRLLTEYSSLFSGLVVELKKYNRTNTVQMERIKSKHEVLLSYVVKDLQKIAAHTDKPSETRYEQTFKDHYHVHIQQTLTKLAQPEIVEAGPVESWQVLKNLYQRFQQRSMHSLSTASSTLKISDVSSILANMHDTAISMPGVDSKHGTPVYIKSIENAIHILPTKTRPKKLVFIGSDGQKYTYLFKGLEDLHLDERIMQFLSISNLMMERTRDRGHQTQVFRAHHYSVIPLGPQSGLISWVDGVTPLFAVYKKWQQRDAVLKQQQNKERPNVEQQTQNGVQVDTSSSELTALRPSELFYKKLRPLLAAQNIKLKDPRKQWPLSVLRRVLDELTDETPNNLLSKELWCHATNAAEWRKAVRNYSISTAVMSVIGYIIGLGDRHLDNVLINLYTGEIVHIDYNVCFEKGKTLRVPEKVPFRLTPNFEHALGITGVEGTFRLSCEYVLKTLRKEKETLLTLLEAFVYDPLVDWTINDEGVGCGTTRANLAYTAMQSVTSTKLGSNANMANIYMRETQLRGSKQFEVIERKKEWEIMQQTIRNKFEDIKLHWSEYINDIEHVLEKILNENERVKTNLQSMQHFEEERNKLNQQMALIRELQMLGAAMGSHSLNTITQRFQTYKQDVESLKSLKKSAEIAHSDIKTLLRTYFEKIMGKVNKFSELKNDIMEQDKHTYVNEFEVVRPYIEQISVKLFEDSSFARKEMDNSLQQEARTALDLIKYLEQYDNIIQFYPRSRLRELNGLFRYARWYNKLCLDNVDLKALKDDVGNFMHSSANTEIVNAVEKSKCIRYVTSMGKILYDLNMDSHQSMVAEEKLLLNDEVTDVETIIKEIKDFADLHENTRSTLQVAMLQILIESLADLETEDKLLNILKEISFIENLKDIFSNLNLIPRSMQQHFEQKMMNALLKTLSAIRDFELDFVMEKVVRLYFLDDNTELQDLLVKLGKGDSTIEMKKVENTETKRELLVVFEILEDKFEIIENQIVLLQHVVEEVLELETCAWYNILLERLSVVRNVKSSEIHSLKYQTLRNMFKAASEQVASLKSNQVDAVYNIHLLVAPVKNCIETLYTKYFKGFTLALTEAYIYSFQINLESYTTPNPAARMLCINLVATFDYNFQLEHLRYKTFQNTLAAAHYMRVASAYVWVNQTLLRDTNTLLTHVILKEQLLSSIKSGNQSMSAWKHTIVKIQDDITQHTKVLEQRLRWIDKKDDASQVIAHFNDCSAEQTKRYKFFLDLAVKLVEHSNTLTQFETVMDDNAIGVNTRCKAVEAFYSHIDDWLQAHNKISQSSALISPVEKNIVQLLDPENKVDACWIENITGLLEELIVGVQKTLSSLEEEARALQERFYEYADELQILTENSLRTDMRQLLRLITKNAKYPAKCSSSSPNLNETETHLTNIARELLQQTKTLFGKMSDLRTKLYLREDFDAEVIKQFEEKSNEVQKILDCQRQELNNLEKHYLENNKYTSRSNSASPARISSPLNDKREFEGTKETEKVEKKGEQKRNAYAVSVWKRIRMKLEGRDPDSNRRSSIAEQIDFIINEATNRDNLAVLYEGWTPWV